MADRHEQPHVATVDARSRTSRSRKQIALAAFENEWFIAILKTPINSESVGFLIELAHADDVGIWCKSSTLAAEIISVFLAPLSDQRDNENITAEATTLFLPFSEIQVLLGPLKMKRSASLAQENHVGLATPFSEPAKAQAKR